MLKKRRIFLLVICFAALCLSVAPAMADFVDLTAYDTMMTVTSTADNGMAATTTIEARVPGTSYMNMFIKDDGGNDLQSPLIAEPYDLTAMLDFTGSGNDYSATGSLEVYDTVDVDPKIAAEFKSTMLTFASSWNPFTGHMGTITMTGYLTPQNTSILLGDPWVFVGANGTISLAGDPADFTHGTMVVFEYNVQFQTLQEFLAVSGAQGSGMLNATIHSTPIPAAVLLGVIGLGVAGLKLRKYA